MRKKNKETTISYEEFSKLCDVIEEGIMDDIDEDYPCCLNCDNCVYICEGDFICDVDEPVLVIDDWEPTDSYFCCNGCDWVSKD